jgi:predicted permease
LLRRDRLFAVAAVSILAVGLGAAVAVLSIADVVFFRPVPHPNPEGLFEIVLEARSTEGTVERTSPSIGEVRHWVSTTHAFSHLAAWQFGTALVIDDGQRQERVSAFNIRQVTERYFDMLGVGPHVGRTFTIADMADGAEHVVMLGHGYWQRRYGGDPGAVGRLITLQRERTRIVGVLPAGFYDGERLTDSVELWLPLRRSRFGQFGRDTSLYVTGRLRPGGDVTAAARELTEATNRLSEETGALPPAAAHLTPFAEAARLHVNFWNLGLLSWAVAMILALGCVNIASLLLARSIVRSKELMIRTSLGATRFRLFRLMLAESLLLSVLGGALGVVLAWFSVNLIVANVVALLPVNTEAVLGWRVLALAAGLAIMVGALVGWVPALRLARVNGAGLIHSDRMPVTQLSGRTGRWLVGIQVALAIVLLNCAGVMLRSVMGLLTTDPGFDPDRSVIVRVSAIDPAIAEKTAQYLPALLQSVRDLPHVEAAGVVDRTSGGYMRQTASAGGRTVPVSVRRVVPGFFEALGVPLRRGRLPVAPDLAPDAPRAVISEALANDLFPGRSAVGDLVQVGGVRPEIVGVVDDVNFAAPYGSAQPEVYLVTGQAYAGYGPALIVRPRGGSLTLAENIRKQVDAVAPGLIVDGVQTFREHLWSFDAVGVRRQQTTMLVVFAGVALLLALVGVFGITLNVVARRAPEVAVRLALGETPAGAVRLVVTDTMKGVGAGVFMGFAATIPASRLVEGLLFQVSPVDAPTLAAVAAAMATAALAAAWLPSRQMSRMAPGAILKAE